MNKSDPTSELKRVCARRAKIQTLIAAPNLDLAYKQLRILMNYRVIGKYETGLRWNSSYFYQSYNF